mmetsp:Transcript_51298/g.148946  ORF Transcript_51298/g.148946 Transcript_51298/m.148946 type:complete len:309 (+) Transcript_51298:253-1179(+)
MAGTGWSGRGNRTSCPSSSKISGIHSGWPMSSFITGLFLNRLTLSSRPWTRAGATSAIFFELRPGRHFRTSTPLNASTKRSRTAMERKLMKQYPTLHLFLKSIGRYTKSNSPLSSSFSCATSISLVYLLGIFLSMTVVPAPLHTESDSDLSSLLACSWEAPPKLSGLPSPCDQLAVSSPAKGAAASPVFHATSSPPGGGRASCSCPELSSTPGSIASSEAGVASSPTTSTRHSPPSWPTGMKPWSIAPVASKSMGPQPQGMYVSVLASYIIGGTAEKGTPMGSKPIISYESMQSPSNAGGSIIPHPLS